MVLEEVVVSAHDGEVEPQLKVLRQKSYVGVSKN